MNLTLEVQNRLAEIRRHMSAMTEQRAGHGPRAQAQIDRTRESLLNGLLVVLIGSIQMWPDDDLGFEGIMINGIHYGLVARRYPDPQFAADEIRWTIHS